MLRNIWIALVEQIFFSVNVFIFCSHLIMMNWFRIVRQSISFISNGIFFSSLTWKIFFLFLSFLLIWKRVFRSTQRKLNCLNFLICSLALSSSSSVSFLCQRQGWKHRSVLVFFKEWNQVLIPQGVDDVSSFWGVITLRSHHFEVLVLGGKHLGWC